MMSFLCSSACSRAAWSFRGNSEASSSICEQAKRPESTSINNNCLEKKFQRLTKENLVFYSNVLGQTRTKTGFPSNQTQRFKVYTEVVKTETTPSVSVRLLTLIGCLLLLVP